jgi:hypothetical protein
MKETIKRWEEGNLVFHTFIGFDDDPDLSYLEQDYSKDKSISKREAKKYAEQDRKRLEAYNRGDWHMCYVGCEVFAKTKTNWAQPPMVARAYLHGIESDSEPSYFEQVAAELKHEALADLKSLKESICS